MVSIVDVAKLAGVSVATVSRALAKPEKVAIETRKKVLQAVAASGYVANAMASNFRRQCSNSILVLVPDIANLFYAAIVQEIELVARNNGYQILLGETQQNLDIDRAYSELVQQKMADGIITLGMNIPFTLDPGCQTVDPQWPPLVMVSEYIGPLSLPSVGIDNVQAAADATQHLLDLGHRDIAFIGGPKDFTLCQERLKGFRRIMRRAGLKVMPGRIQFGEFKLASGYSQVQRLLEADSLPSALLCANDEIAMGAMKAVRERGLRVSEDISLIGFDNIDMADYLSPPLTTIHQPRREMGRAAMELMLAILMGRHINDNNKRLVLSHELVVRASTGPAPRRPSNQ